jgi:hypothetical protein
MALFQFFVNRFVLIANVVSPQWSRSSDTGCTNRKDQSRPRPVLLDQITILFDRVLNSAEYASILVLSCLVACVCYICDV